MTTHRKKKFEKENGVIHFAPAKHLLQQARTYIEDLERFVEERDRALPILLRGLQLGDRKLKRQITMLLGGFAGSEIAGPLYRIIKDTAEDGDLRHEAAVQLGMTLPLVKDPRSLVNSLLKDLKSTDAELRSHAALGLGWEGNYRAVETLVERLDDPEEFVQQAAVNALLSLGDERVLEPMLHRLEHGSREQKRTILINLWRFQIRRAEVAGVYKQQLDVADDELRFDALVLLGRVTDTRDQIPFYRNCLKDRDPRVREKALERLAELEPEDLIELKPECEAMLSDPDARVKQAAIRVLTRIGPAGS